MPIKGVSAAIVLLSIPIGGIALYSIILRCVDRALSKYDILNGMLTSFFRKLRQKKRSKWMGRENPLNTE